MDALSDPGPLVASWRNAAAKLRAWGATSKATVLDRCADELEEHVASWADTPLTIAEASGECGYSASHLRRLVSQGVLRDMGTSTVTLVRRGDLPRKAGTNRHPLPVGVLSSI